MQEHLLNLLFPIGDARPSLLAGKQDLLPQVHGPQYKNRVPTPSSPEQPLIAPGRERWRPSHGSESGGSSLMLEDRALLSLPGSF